MSDEESAEALGRYRVTHPQASKQLMGAIEHIARGPVETLPMVELTLTNA